VDVESIGRETVSFSRIIFNCDDLQKLGWCFMFCPKCKGEFVEGISECLDCKGPLTEDEPQREKNTRPITGEVVTVLTSFDAGEIMVAKSVLDGAGIPYLATGEGLEYYLGSSRGVLLNGPVKLQVAKDDAEVAEALLVHQD
jgi:hypothetical protein